MKMSLFLAVLFCARANAFVWSAQFVDRCSSRPVQLSNPNGTALELVFQEMGTEGPIGLSLSWSFSDEAGFTVRSPTIEQNFQLHSKPSQGPHRFQFLLPESPVPQARMLQARVEIRTSEKREELNAEVLVTPPGFEFFLKTGEPVSYWVAGGDIKSEFHEAQGPTSSLIRRKIVQSVEAGSGPAYAGLFYAGKSRDSYFRKEVQIEREWELSPGQGGVFMEWTFFRRFPGVRYVWRVGSQGSCGGYVAQPPGFFDEGEIFEDFFVIPKSISMEPRSIRRFLEDRFPQKP